MKSLVFSRFSVYNDNMSGKSIYLQPAFNVVLCNLGLCWLLQANSLRHLFTNVVLPVHEISSL